MAESTAKKISPDPEIVSKWTRPPEAKASVDSFMQVLGSVQKIHTDWLQRMDELRQKEAEFGVKLLECKNPSQVVSVWNDWLVGRFGAIVSEQQILTKSWTDVLTEVSQVALSGAKSDKA